MIRSLRRIPKNAPPKNILITRLSAIGDCILTLPLAVRAKQLWPDAKLTWVVDCGAAPLLEDHPCIDEIYRVEKKWPLKLDNWLGMRKDLRQRQFDLVLDPQGLSKSSLLGWLSGARTRIGFDYSHGRELAPMLATHRVHRTARHMVDTYLQLLDPYTGSVDTTHSTNPTSTNPTSTNPTSTNPTQAISEPAFRMPVYEAEAEWARAALVELDLQDALSDRSGGQPWVMINPGAGWSTRLWPVERFGQLAQYMQKRHGRRVLVSWAGETERLMASVIAEESRGAAMVAPPTSLRQLVELLRRAPLMITGDTGPLHLASAVGTPRVSLHGPTWADESGPYGGRFLAIQSPITRPSGKLERSGLNHTMQAIELDEVIHAVERMICQEPNLKQAAA